MKAAGEGRAVDGVDRMLVVVVAHNSEAVLESCLRALRNAAEALRLARGTLIRLVVVDNASAVPVVIDDHAMRTEVLRLDDNVGFSPAANDGATRDLESRLILFLNPDTELDRDALIELAGAFDDPTTALAGPLLLAADDHPEVSERPFHSLGCELRTQFLPTLGRGAYGKRQFATQQGRCLSGACLLVDGRFFREVGGFDTSVRMYLEDVELCWRAHSDRRAVRFVPTARCFHGLGAGSGGVNFQSRLDLHLTLLGARIEFVRRRSGPVAGAAMRLTIAIGALMRWPVSLVCGGRPERHGAVLRWALSSGRVPEWGTPLEIGTDR